MESEVSQRGAGGTSGSRWVKSLVTAAFCCLFGGQCVRGQATQPLVAVHDSELTRALEAMPASGSTPTGAGTTGFQWWPAAWHYFVMPDSVTETLRSDGTVFATIHDADISAGALLTSNGLPAYPIVISLASEAVRDDEVAQFTNYVAAGGTLLVGSSAFTRNPDGTSRGDFALASALGLHMANASLQNWAANFIFSKAVSHPLTAHIPGGLLNWDMPVAADEITSGISPDHNLSLGQLCWQVQPSNTVVIAQGDTSPYLLVTPYGKGCFIYDAAMQPLLGHGAGAPGFYAYGIFRNAIEGAFAAARLPIPKLSSWPFPYNAALSVRHDFGNSQPEINSIASSALFESTNGVAGDYFFCTGTLRVEMTNSSATIASLRLAVSSYNATIGPQNGGLPNPNNPALTLGDFDYWNWGPDEALDVAAANLPAGYPNGAAYASASVSNSFSDVEGWLAGLTNGLRITTAPYYDATREASCQIQQQLGVNVSGEQKLGPFPSWVLSTSLQTADKRYPFISLPPSDWFVTTPDLAADMEDGFGYWTMEEMVDSYYNWGGLINLRSHSSSDGGGIAGTLASDYITYSLSKPGIWPANASSIYSWWLARSNAQISAVYGTNGNQSVVTFAINGATDPRTAVEVRVPGPAVSGLQVFTNGAPSGSSSYLTNGSIIRVLVGTSVTNVQITYLLNPSIQNSFYTGAEGTLLTVLAPGVLSNAMPGIGMNLSATLVSGTANGALGLTHNGGFTYVPANNFIGVDAFEWQANNGVTTSSVATATLDITPPGSLFYDNFLRPANADPLAPWVPVLGNWTIAAGQLQGTDSDAATENNAYVPGNWTNFSVEAQIQFPPNALGGGLNGRVNPLTGAKYTVEVYPNGIPGQTGMPQIELLKYHTWQILGPLPMAQVQLAAMDTNWHTLRAAFVGNEIRVYFDGALMMDVTDASFDGLPPYLSGGIGAQFYTFDAPYVMSFDDFLVNTAPVAASDGYAAIENRTLTVAAPGVLANDVPGLGTNMTARLVTAATNGVLALNSNGGFSYTPTKNFVGTDSFAYQANDGAGASAVVGVSLIVLTNTPPTANNDSYSFVANSTLTLAAPGVLANDIDVDGASMTAVLVSGPAYGTLNLSSNGGFSYTPATNFSGIDTFTYYADDGSATSGTATVTFSDPSAGSLFYENFARTNDPGSLSPWLEQSNLWTVTGGMLQGGADASSTYGNVDLTNSWDDFAVQAQFQFTAGAYGGGLGGRLNAATGAHYAAWIYPNANNLNLISFQDWVTPTFLATASLPTVGTNWHTLKLAFVGNQIAVYYDGNQVVSAADPQAQPYLSGGISVDMYTDATPYTMSVASVAVSPLAQADNYHANENTTLIVPALGVLGNDTGVYDTNLTAALVSGPAHGSLNFSSNGGFSYTPAANFLGVDSFTYSASDSQTNLGTATVGITVYNVNHAPILPLQHNFTIIPLSTLVVTNTATNADIPADTFVYTLASAPTNAVINASGVITWTPTRAQTQSTNVFTTVVTEHDPWSLNAQYLSATNSFTVFVNSSPVLALDSTTLIAETCLPTNNAIDPGETVTVLFDLKNTGNGSTANLVGTLLSGNGIVSPSGPQTYGALAPGGLSASEPFMFTAEGGCGGIITATLQLQDGSINLGTVSTSFTLGKPANVLTQNFDSVTTPALPTGWATSVTGSQVPWVTTNANADTLPNAAFAQDVPNTGISELDSPLLALPAGSAQLSFRQSYNLESGAGTDGFDGGVLEIRIGTNAYADILAAGGSFVSGGYTSIIDTHWNNPLMGRHAWSGNSQGYVTTLVNLPAAAAGQSIQLRWRLATDAGNAYPVTGWFVDSINITGLACCAHTGPLLPAQSNWTINELTTLVVTNTATDPQNPSAVLAYSLVNPPAGAGIGTNGVILWTPSASQGPGNYLVTTIATEGGATPLSATNSFAVTVNQIVIPPPQTNFSPVAVLTHHNDLARTGANPNETILNIYNVNTNQFGLLFTRAVDDQIYSQPLIMTNVSIPGQGLHDIVIVATVNDSVYAFDADNPLAATAYWHTSFLGPNVTPPTSTDVAGNSGGCTLITGNIGIVGTPVIDPVAGTIYLVARTKENGSMFVQRLHALDITTGLERPNSPAVISATYPGTNSSDSVNGVITFNPLTQNQRSGLALVSGTVYISWASHCDIQPYHGWVMGYDATTLQQEVVYVTTPNGTEGGIWMSGQPPAADTNGNLYLSIGNGPFNNNISPQNPADRVESLLKLTRSGNSLVVASSFTPYNWQSLDSTDDDLGSSGVLLIPGTTLAFSGSKQGKAYLVNRDNMGGLNSGSSDANIVQSFQVTATTGFDNIHGAPVWWDGPAGSYAYVQGEADYLRQYKFDWTNQVFLLPNYAESPTTAPTDGMPGGILSVSANGTNQGTGIVWATHQYSGDAESSTRPGILHAYNAENVSQELWNSQQLSARDSVGNFGKFVPPTVANGKVYLATFSNRLNIYGVPPPAALNIALSGGNATLSWWTNPITSYNLQICTNLPSGYWTTLTNSALPANGMLQVTVRASAATAYYRLKH